MGAQGQHIRLFGVALYSQLYWEFMSGVKRQEVVASLVNHAASSALTSGKVRGDKGLAEVDAALAVLLAVNASERATQLGARSGAAGLAVPRHGESEVMASQTLVPRVTPRTIHGASLGLWTFAPFVKTLLEDVRFMHTARARKV
jgi:hypothetical protein